MDVKRIVVDTNVLAAAMLSPLGENRDVLRGCLERRARPIVGQALIGEYEDVLARTALFSGCPLTAVERNQLLNAFLSVSEWVKVYYSWRPNLRDEADNHLIELAVAGGADMIVSNNVRHLTAGELRFPEIRILRSKEFLQQL